MVRSVDTVTGNFWQTLLLRSKVELKWKLFYFLEERSEWATSQFFCSTHERARMRYRSQVGINHPSWMTFVKRNNALMLEAPSLQGSALDSAFGNRNLVDKQNCPLNQRHVQSLSLGSRYTAQPLHCAVLQHLFFGRAVQRSCI